MLKWLYAMLMAMGVLGVLLGWTIFSTLYPKISFVCGMVFSFIFLTYLFKTMRP